MEKESDIILREWREEDFRPTAEIVNQTWWEGSMNEKSDHLVSNAFLRACLKDQSYIRVAEKDGKILGVIMGCDRRNHHPSFTERLKYWQSALFLLLDHDARHMAMEDGGEEKLHKELLHKAGEKNYDAEVPFFIVSEEARGMGVGKKLFVSLMEYFRDNNVNSWYVFTDTDCSYQFYEHVGARRQAEIYEEYTLPNGNKGDITWFLYDYERA